MKVLPSSASLASSQALTASTPTKPGPSKKSRSESAPFCSAKRPNCSKVGRTSLAGIDLGKPYTIATRGPAAPRWRVRSRASRTERARSAISTSEARGLTTVSIRVAVSPKSLTKLMGPAPWGRSLIVSSLSLMSSNCLPTSATPFWSRMATTVTLVRVLDVMRSILEFSAIFSSIRRVTSCSIFSALAPGQEQTAIASRTGMSGSLRRGMER